MFEEAEFQIQQLIENILRERKVPVRIGVPDSDWIKQYGYPLAAVMINNVRIVDWIEDGCPESQKEDGSKVIVENAIAEAQMVFALHLACAKKSELDKLTIVLLSGIYQTRYFGTNDEYHFGNEIGFRDELPGPEAERIFERIFTLPVSGTLTNVTITEKGEVEYVGEVSTDAEVLNQTEQEE